MNGALSIVATERESRWSFAIPGNGGFQTLRKKIIGGGTQLNTSLVKGERGH